MKAVVLSAATIALIGFAAKAQDAGHTPPDEQEVPSGTERTGRSTAQAPWTESATDESSLLTQFNAVIGALRAKAAPAIELADTTVLVTAAMNDEIVSHEANCRFMPSPGSRIHTERCFNDSDTEKTLNEYQFDEELRFARQEAVRRQFEEATRQAQQEVLMRASRPAGGVPR